MSHPDNNPARWLIITDLDGTLLDHHNYSFEAAKTSLDELARQQVPVIINSSKTLAEIIDIKTALGISTPCIVENGSAIISEQEPPIILGQPWSTIIDKLATLPTKMKEQYRGFNDCSVNDVIEMTGLDDAQASKALQRQYTEPVKWLGDESSRQIFIKTVKKLGLNILVGGRFMHIMGHTDKGQASLQLKTLYAKKYQSLFTIMALGDSHNDIAMLEASDIAVVVRNDSSDTLTLDHKSLYRTQQSGPAGWAEAINKFMEPLIKPEGNF